MITIRIQRAALSGFNNPFRAHFVRPTFLARLIVTILWSFTKPHVFILFEYSKQVLLNGFLLLRFVCLHSKKIKQNTL